MPTTDIVTAVLEHEAQEGRKFRVVSIKRKRGTIAGSHLIPGGLEIQVELVEGHGSPGQGMIIQNPGEEPQVIPVKGKIPIATATRDADGQSGSGDKPKVTNIQRVAVMPKPKSGTELSAPAKPGSSS
jgi:hypothetical protein